MVEPECTLDYYVASAFICVAVDQQVRGRSVLVALVFLIFTLLLLSLCALFYHAVSTKNE